DSNVFERYGIESVVRRIDDLYEQILARRTRQVRPAAVRSEPPVPRLPASSPASGPGTPVATGAGGRPSGGGSGQAARIIRARINPAAVLRGRPGSAIMNATS